MRPTAQGQGVGAALVAWAEDYVRERGKRYLRLDCVAANRALRAYYQGLGFSLRGEAAEGGYASALYEMRL